jgi:hypothetical protein
MRFPPVLGHFSILYEVVAQRARAATLLEQRICKVPDLE